HRLGQVVQEPHDGRVDPGDLPGLLSQHRVVEAEDLADRHVQLGFYRERNSANLLRTKMAPADLLQPLEGQREETLRVIESLASRDLETVVRGDGRTVHQVLCHLVDREHGINFAIRRALAGEVLRLSQEERDEIARSESEPAPTDWGIDRIRIELLEARETLRRTFLAMTEEDLDRP